MGWWLAPLVLLGLAVAVHAVRVSRVERVTGLGGAGAVVRDAASPTGFARGVRMLLVPGQDYESYQWIVQTQQMVADGALRVRDVRYDNAPEGRTTWWTSPARWWLAGIGGARAFVTDQSWGFEVERGALWANPLLHLLLVAGVFAAVVCRCGWAAAIISGAMAVVFYPFVSAFPAAQPNAVGLGLVLALMSLWVLGTAVGEANVARESPGGQGGLARGNARRVRNRAVIAGGLGALALWVSPGMQVGFIVGAAVGGLVEAAATRRAVSTGLWRAWGLSGGAGTLVVYLLEFAPTHLGEWHLDAVHPVYGLAWLGVGDGMERLVRAWARREAQAQGPTTPPPEEVVLSLRTPESDPGQDSDKVEAKPPGRLRRWVGPAVAVLAMASLPLVMWKTEFAGWGGGLELQRLSRIPGAPEARNLLDWWNRDGASLALVATLLPVVLLVIVGIGAWKRRRAGAVGGESAVFFAAGPAVVWLLIALMRLDAWAAWGAAMVVLAAVATGAVMRSGNAGARIVWGVAVVAVLLPSAMLLLRDAARQRAPAISEEELTALINRDLAHWLAVRVGDEGGNVLAPPVMTASLCYHGGLSGLGTPDPDNRDGFAAAVRIAGATSQDEAHALVQRRGVTHVIVPSWDGFLDEYARLGADDFDKSLVALLHQWLPPRWLRPVPYLLPTIEGFEGQSAAVFEVVEVQDHVLALSRLADTFVELGQVGAATAVATTLETHFPNDVGAWVTRAQVHAARQDANGFRETLRLLMPAVQAGDTAGLPWDRQVALAAVLAQAREQEAAKAVVSSCVGTANAERLRSLGPGALYRFFVLQGTFGVRLREPALTDLAGRLLPPEMRAELGL